MGEVHDMNGNVIEPAEPENVVELNADRYGHIPPQELLDMAKNADMEELTIVGYLPDGSLYVSSSNENLESVITLLELGKRKMLSVIEEAMQPD